MKRLLWFAAVLVGGCRPIHDVAPPVAEARPRASIEVSPNYALIFVRLVERY
jgi:hypothetical protein